MFRLNLWTRPFLHPNGAPGVENTSYMPNPLASPALMVLASSAEQGRDGAHLPQGHPLASSGHAGGDKEPPTLPFSAASFPFFRPGDHIPPPLYSHLHQPFLRPHLDPAAFGLISPRGGGAFHPLPEDRESYPSAFMPTKKLKLDDSHDRLDRLDRLDMKEDEKSLRGESEGSRGRPSPFSPGERHSSPALSGMDSPIDLHSDAGDRNSPDGSVKGLHKWYSPEGLCCPICKAILQPGEIQSHLAKEVAELHHLFNRNKISPSDSPSVSDRERNDFLFSVNGTREVSSKSRYETFLRIKNNREARLARIRGRRKRYHDEMTVNSSGDSETLNGSAEHPKQKEAEDETIDVIGYEEADKVGRAVQADGSLKPAEGQTDSDRLKADGREENGNTIHSKERVKCSACSCPYTSPVTSVQCWHVHCEKCWIEALNNKKLCPQCSIVTSHADLRRIYI